MVQHIIFYDGECPLCNRLVRFLLSVDTHKRFLFAHLGGKTAQDTLKDHPHLIADVDTMVVLENYQTPNQRMLLRGKAALRICWHLGGFWRLLGWLSFLPAFPFDLFYCLVAKNRFRLFQKGNHLPMDDYSDRFLP